jgi:site-specific recombinase XerD
MATIYRRPIASARICKDGAAPYSTPTSCGNQPNPARGGRKLLEVFRDKMRALHYALATEKAYLHWVVEFLRFHRTGGEWSHPATLGKPEIEAFLTHLATHRKVSAKTQNQAFSAILFLYKQVLGMDLPTIDALRAKQSRRLPVVLSQQQVARLIDHVEGGGGLCRLMVELTYGAGLRLLECCRLRVKDVDFDRRQLTVREGKGDKDRLQAVAPTW